MKRLLHRFAHRLGMVSGYVESHYGIDGQLYVHLACGDCHEPLYCDRARLTCEG